MLARAALKPSPTPQAELAVSDAVAFSALVEVASAALPDNVNEPTDTAAA